MAWKDNIDNIKFSIKTGDGKVYYPLWKNASKTKEFNVTKYDFINVEGSLVERNRPQSGKFPLVFWFQGEDYIQDSDNFELSANDNRPWTITHPIYGTINGQPTNLSRLDTSLNTTEIKVDFWESIGVDFPKSEISIQDDVRQRVENVRFEALNTFEVNSNPDSGDIPFTSELSSFTFAKLKPDEINFTEFQNKVKKAEKSITLLVSDTLTVATNIQEVYNEGALFVTKTKDRIESYVDIFNDLKDSFEKTTDKYNKIFFESQASAVISGMVLASVNPIEGDYNTRNRVQEIDDIIRSTYLDYLTFLDSLQVSIYDVENTYNPDIRVQNLLRDLIAVNSKNLFSLAFDAKQERILELEKDSNLIVLTHRFLGLDASDENISEFKNINDIGLNEIFQIKKGRLITYYV